MLAEIFIIICPAVIVCLGPILVATNISDVDIQYS